MSLFGSSLVKGRRIRVSFSLIHAILNLLRFGYQNVHEKIVFDVLPISSMVTAILMIRKVFKSSLTIKIFDKHWELFRKFLLLNRSNPGIPRRLDRYSSTKKLVVKNKWISCVSVSVMKLKEITELNYDRLWQERIF